MSLFDKFHKGKGLSSTTTIALTDLGSRQVEEATEKGMRYLIIETLDSSPKTLAVLSRELNADPSQVESVVRGLKKSGYVHTLHGEE